MDLKIEHFGIAIYHQTGFKKKFVYKQDDGTWDTPRPKSVTIGGYKYIDTDEVSNKWYCYFVMDVKKTTRSPICLWKMAYSTKTTIDKMLQAATNTGMAMLMSKSNKKLPNAVQMVVNLKMAYFGNKDVPVKWLTKEEWKGRYSQMIGTTKNNLIEF